MREIKDSAEALTLVYGFEEKEGTLTVRRASFLYLGVRYEGS